MAATSKPRAFTQPKPTPQTKGQPVSWWLNAKRDGFTKLAERSCVDSPLTADTVGKRSKAERRTAEGGR